MMQETTKGKKKTEEMETKVEEEKKDQAQQDAGKENATAGSTGDEGKERNVLEEFGDSVGKFATKTFESIRKSIDQALDSRNTVLTIRITDDANEKMRMLVETGLFKSRSESAAYLIEEGIKHQALLFDKIAEKMEQINKLRDDIKGIVSSEIKQKEDL